MLGHISIKPAVAVVAGSVAAITLMVASPAQAASGTIRYSGNGKCVVNGNTTLDVKSSPGWVYGFSSTLEWVHLYMSLVDKSGNLQATNGWADLGWYHASASSPVSFPALTITRGRWQTYSRFILGVKWYQGNTYVGWTTRTLYSYDMYNMSIIGPNYIPIETYVGVSDSCFL